MVVLTGVDGDAVVPLGVGRCGAVQRALAWIGEMTLLDADVERDGDRIDLLAVLEAVKAASAALQARVTADFVVSQTAAAQELAAADVSVVGMVRPELRPEVVRRSVCGQVALARREAPDRGSVLVNLARALTADLPGTLAALTAGVISEYRALLVHRETACLSSELRREADAALAAVLPGLGNRQVGERAREQALRLDPEAAKGRVRAAVGGRRVTVRRAPDAMAYLTALLPAGAATVCVRSLERHADATIAAGAEGADRPDGPVRPDGTDRSGAVGPRGRGAVMADEFVARLTRGVITGCDELGAPTGEPGNPTDRSDRADRGSAAPSVPPDPTCPGRAEAGAEPSADRAPDDSDGSLGLLVHLVMTDRALFGGDVEPAQVIGYGPIPAEVARRMVAAGLGPRARTWITRLFTDPETGRLAAMDSRSRLFPDSLKGFLLVRDRQCRMPYCGAPARHADHVVPHAHGGPTSVANGQCTSVNCNLLKEAHGWSAAPAADGTITVRTPTGHRYRSDEPPPPHSPPWDTPAPDRPARPGPQSGRGSHAGDATAPVGSDPPPQQDTEPAEWERILEAALAGADEADPASPQIPETRVGKRLPPDGFRIPRTVTALRRKLPRDQPGRKRGRRPRPPARGRPAPIDPTIARRRLDLLSQIREGTVNRR